MVPYTEQRVCLHCTQVFRVEVMGRTAVTVSVGRTRRRRATVKSAVFIMVCVVVVSTKMDAVRLLLLLLLATILLVGVVCGEREETSRKNSSH